MRLLNCRTIRLEDFLEDAAPKYAILSHTWGDQEVSHEDMQRLTAAELDMTRGGGYSKLVGACAQALRDGLGYLWADTCCIDKSSSAELSEAINSMFRWYARAQVCYAYLVDVPGSHSYSSSPPSNVGAADDDDSAKEEEEADAAASVVNTPAFASSRWFTRGWTLQELLAPRRLIFYASDWSRLASKAAVTALLERITKVDAYYLGASSRPNAAALPRLHRAGAAERMSWASGRQTTRPEDMAYCLLGLFGINMPLVYGEGGPRAFRRLQEEIMRGCDDMSLLAWRATSSGQYHPAATTTTPTVAEWSFLADSPASFANSGNIVPVDDGGAASSDKRVGSRRTPFAVTNKGLQVDLPLTDGKRSLPYILLRCCLKADPATIVALEVIRSAGNELYRGWPALEFVDHKAWQRSRSETFYLYTGRGTASLASQWQAQANSILVRIIPEGFEIRAVYPRANVFAARTAVLMDMEYMPKKGVSRMYVEFGSSSGQGDRYVLMLTRYSYRGKLHVVYHMYFLSCLAPSWRSTTLSYSTECGNSAELTVNLSKTLDVDEGAFYATVRRESVFGTDMFMADIILARKPPLVLWLMDRQQTLLFANSFPARARYEREAGWCRLTVIVPWDERIALTAGVGTSLALLFLIAVGFVVNRFTTKICSGDLYLVEFLATGIITAAYLAVAIFILAVLDRFAFERSTIS